MFDEFDREIFASGQQIFKYGDIGDCAYLVEEGTVEVLIVKDGSEQRIRLIGKGELFGEVSLIDYEPRTATIRAIERTVLVPIQRKMMEGLLEKSDPVLRPFVAGHSGTFQAQKRWLGISGNERKGPTGAIQAPQHREGRGDAKTVACTRNEARSGP